MTYPKLVFSFVFSLAFSLQNLHSQELVKIPVGVAPIEWNSRTANSTYVSMIYDHLTYLLNNNSAVTVVDRQGWELIQEERELLKTEPFILTETIQQGMSLGAQKLVTSKVYLTDLQQAGTGFEVTFSIYLAIVDVETGVVEDNIMLSPRGLEDSDKIIEIMKAIRRARLLPTNRFVDRVISIMELFDVLTKYQVGGLTQDDAFKEALNQLDKSLIPFFDYHFKGVTDGSYTPDNEKRISPVVDSYEKEEAPEELKYPIVERISDTEVRIFGGELDGIKPLSRLDLIIENDFIDTTWTGEIVKGVDVKNVGRLSFKNYEGEFSVFTWLKSNDTDLATVISDRDNGSRIFLLEADPSLKDIDEEGPKFGIVDIEADQILKIAGSTKNGIKKSSRFSLVREKLVTFVDFNGVERTGIRREELATLKFLEDRGDLQLLELVERGGESNLREILGRPKPGEQIYVLFKLKNY